MLLISSGLLRKSWVVVLRVCHEERLGFRRLLPDYRLLLLDYRLLLQDFPLRHPDSRLQGLQKGCSVGLGGLVPLLLRVVLIPPPSLFQQRKIVGLWVAVGLV